MARRHPDWLLFAVNNLGGATRAAKKIGVSKSAVANWLLNGTARARHGDVVRLVELAKMPAEPRLGPPRKSDARCCERAGGSRIVSGDDWVRGEGL
jgi:hypothetical protein